LANTCTQATLTALLRDVDSLEGYKNILYGQQSVFLGQANAFQLGSLSTPTQVQNDLLNVNTSSVGCSPTDFPAVTDFTNICVNKYLGNLLGKKDSTNQDMTGFLDTLLSIAERPLMVALQALFALFDKFGLSSLINALDTNINCITSSEDAARYTTEIDDINKRVDAVVKDLAINDQGEFDFDKLTTSVDTGLKNNLEAGYFKAQQVCQESKDNIDAKVSQASTVVPEGYF